MSTTMTYGRRPGGVRLARAAAADGLEAYAGRRGAPDGRSRVERLIFGVPARYMGPRLIIYVCTFALIAFGILMIYSSSSVTAMSDAGLDYNPAYYAQRQLIFVGVGLIPVAIVAVTDYHIWSQRLIMPIWFVTMGLLGLVFTASVGAGAYGATRWISFGPFNLQPSEFAKVTVILAMASVSSRYLEERTIGTSGFIRRVAIEVVVPLGAILVQPDKGTTIICAATLLVMAYLAGIKKRWLLMVLAAAAILVAVLILQDDYSRARLMVAWDPWIDEWDTGYQLIQGLYAFSSGGIFGLGMGMSRQKYSYLPMAHNDFIYAIVGEELGLVGTVGVLVVFAVLVWASFQVARRAPDLTGRLIAAGCSSLIIIQLAVNVGGVLGMIPLTGKPVPFISYGGSSIISSMLLVAFIISVSRHSALPETEADERRRDYAPIAAPSDSRQAQPALTGLTLVGEPTPRSRRGQGDSPKGGAVAPVPPLRPVQLTVLGGGRSASASAPDPSDRSPEALRATRSFEESHRGGRVSIDSKGRRRIDLGPDAATRLRGR